jgi:hypothetical protein
MLIMLSGLTRYFWTMSNPSLRKIPNIQFRKSGQALEESLVLCPIEQQDWFSNRHLFDLVIIYDEESRVNSYTGGPTLDVHQVRLRNLAIAIYDYAGYRKSLKHVPMLLVGGVRAWCNLVHEFPLRQVTWKSDDAIKTSSKPQGAKPVFKQTPDVSRVGRQVDELDLEAESQWLESLHPDGLDPLSNSDNLVTDLKITLF